MTKKKSKAQINRLKKRAAARGEEYVYSPPTPSDGDESSTTRSPAPDDKPGDERRDANATKLAAAQKLRRELHEIEADTEMKSKDRRSAKRRAHAIALEESGCEAEDLLRWLEEHGKPETAAAKVKGKNNKLGENERSRKKNPYIVFVGQLSYDTTSEGLFNHIKTELGGDHEVTEETIQIRLLTDTKTNKSRGMAFVETADPELLYALLKLHHTHLEGRRINVERTVGGGKNSETRKARLSLLRKEQEKHISDTVDKMLSEYLSSGELQEKELDDGVIALCKRHSAPVVEAALAEYISKGGRDMDNPSAYLTFLIGKIATEGIDDPEDKRSGTKGRIGRNPEKSRPHRPTKRPRHRSSGSVQTELGTIGNKLQDASTFFQAGVDMSASNASTNQDVSKIFPSMRRGRRRGYM